MAVRTLPFDQAHRRARQQLWSTLAEAFQAVPPFGAEAPLLEVGARANADSLVRASDLAPGPCSFIVRGALTYSRAWLLATFRPRAHSGVA
jgi:hypothetical protein